MLMFQAVLKYYSNQFSVGNSLYIEKMEKNEYSCKNAIELYKTWYTISVIRIPRETQC